nr:hypothetical protein [Dendronalium phyllosphericum CENA369]
TKPPPSGRGFNLSCAIQGFFAPLAGEALTFFGANFFPYSLLPTPHSRPEGGVNVQKVRYSQPYRVLSNFSVQAVATNEDIDNGCHVEITQLIIQERSWWSFALKAFGEDARLIDNLRTTASSIFNTYQGAKLLAANSYAYPHCLSLVCQ